MGRPLGSKNKISKKKSKDCISCGSEFSYYPSRERRGVYYCSFECTKKQKEVSCSQCNTTFKKAISHVFERNFCNKKCMGRYKFTADRNPQWKGGITGPEHNKAVNDAWREKNKQAILARATVRFHKKRATSGSFTCEEWRELKAKYGHMCLCCKETEPAIKLTVDHIIPISKGGSSNIENIQPLCHSCNARKHVTPIDYSKNLTYLTD